MPASFDENTSVNGAYKASLFKSLFSSRKALLTGYPAAKKGLAFPELALRFGNQPSTAAYSFKTTEIADKVSAQHNGHEFQARCKKDTKNWDISLKQKVGDVNLLCKYEERGLAEPVYLVGGTCKVNANATVDCKVNLSTAVVKNSFLLKMNEGLKVAGDIKVNTLSPSSGVMKWNLGASYAHKFGLTAVALNQSKFATLNHSHKIDASTNFTVEAVQMLAGDKRAGPVACGIGKKLDDDHTLKMRVNSAGQVNAKVEKQFGKNLCIEAATCVDFNDMKTLKVMPAFGFKIITKG